MKKNMRFVSLFLTLITLLSVLTAFATPVSAASSIMRQNTSSSPVSCNASNGNLPASTTSVNAGSSLYFNVQTDSSFMVKTADLYMKKPGQSSYSKVYTETVSGYMRYTYTKQSVGSTSGTLYYYWKLTLTNGTVKTLSSSSITVKAVASSAVMRQNASSSPVSCNASNGSLPASTASVNAGSSLYFNVQVDNTLMVKTADLYMKKPGQSSYTRVYTESASGYMRYTYTKQSVGSTSGTLFYYWKLTLTNGTVKTLSSTSITIKAVSTSPANSFNPVWPCASTSNYISTMYRYWNGGNVSNHGCRSNIYNAVDICRPDGRSGDAIFAIESGTVVEKGYTGATSGFGHYIVIEHNNGLRSLYGHMKEASKLTKGDKVVRGQTIGYMGSTGNSSGTHLHFEVYNPNSLSSVIDPFASYYKGKVNVTIGGNSYRANSKYASSDSRANTWCAWLTNSCKKNSSGDYVFTK